MYFYHTVYISVHPEISLFQELSYNENGINYDNEPACYIISSWFAMHDNAFDIESMQIPARYNC